MKKLILSTFALVMFYQAFSAAIICYQTPYGEDCFYTNYNCDDFDNCTQNCSCIPLSVISVNDPIAGTFQIKTEGTVLSIRKMWTRDWTTLVDLASFIEYVETKVWKITMNCAFDRVTISVFDAICLNDPECNGNYFVSSKSIYYVCP